MAGYRFIGSRGRPRKFWGRLQFRKVHFLRGAGTTHLPQKETGCERIIAAGIVGVPYWLKLFPWARGVKAARHPVTVAGESSNPSRSIPFPCGKAVSQGQVGGRRQGATLLKVTCFDVGIAAIIVMRP